jgi:3-hydroxyacyl-CoA dehydrogenase
MRRTSATRLVVLNRKLPDNVQERWQFAATCQFWGPDPLIRLIEVVDGVATGATVEALGPTVPDAIANAVTRIRLLEARRNRTH